MFVSLHRTSATAIIVAVSISAQGRVVGGDATDHFHQLHAVHRVEEGPSLVYMLLMAFASYIKTIDRQQ